MPYTTGMAPMTVLSSVTKVVSMQQLVNIAIVAVTGQIHIYSMCSTMSSLYISDATSTTTAHGQKCSLIETQHGQHRCPHLLTHIYSGNMVLPPHSRVRVSSQLMLWVWMVRRLLADAQPPNILSAVYEKDKVYQHVPGTSYLNVTLLHYGLLSSNPFKPSIVFTIPTLEMFHRLCLQSPHVSIQAWIRVLCDIHNICHVPSSHCSLGGDISSFLDQLPTPSL